MRKNFLISILVVTGLFAANTPVTAQTYGPSMMEDDQTYSNRGDCDHGHGMMGNGNSQISGRGQSDSQGEYQDQNYGPDYHMRGSRGDYGPSMMQGNGYGSGMMQGNGRSYRNNSGREEYTRKNQTLNLTTDDVKSRVERWLVRQGNARLKVGDVKEKDVDTITADVITKDNSLVDRFIVDRHTGAVRQDKS